MRTLAIASLRRAVPAAFPVTTGRRVAAARAGPSCADSVVYSDGTSAPYSSSASSTSSSTLGVVTPVGSATVLFLVLPACTARLLRDLRDLVRLRPLSLMRVVRAGVHLELAQRLAA